MRNKNVLVAKTKMEILCMFSPNQITLGNGKVFIILNVLKTEISLFPEWARFTLSSISKVAREIRYLSIFHNIPKCDQPDNLNS